MIDLAHLLDAATSAVRKMYPDDDLHSIEEVGISDEMAPVVIPLLLMVQAIRTTQGTKRVYFLDPAQHGSEAMIESLRGLVTRVRAELEAGGGAALPKSDVVALLNSYRFDEEHYYSLVRLLSLAGVATSAGRGRSGGIALYRPEIEQEQVSRAEEAIGGAALEERAERETEHESVLYPAAEKFLADLGFQAITLGGQRRLRGEWSTPDVIGYKVNRHTVLCGATVEVATVEVKWSISKGAIAEAGSHQRLGHRTYLMVHQEFEHLEEQHLEDLQLRGIGLICLRNVQPALHIAARRNPIEDNDVDAFLSVALAPDHARAIKLELARYFTRDTTGVLAG